MKTGYLLLFLVLVATAFVLPDIVTAQEPTRLVPTCIHEGFVECTVCDLVNLGKNIIDFFVFFSVAIAVLLFINAGVLYVFSPANPGNISKAHRIFSSALIGLLIVLASWIIIDAVMRALYSPPGAPWGPWNGILCRGGPAGPVATAITPSTSVYAGPSGGTVSDNTARIALQPHATIWESSPGATSLNGLQNTTLDGIIALANASGIPRDQLIITGGTEAMHASGQYSHAEGYKVDFEDNQAMNNYIQTAFTPTGLRSGDPRYTGQVNGRQVECVMESTHWDCTFFPT